MDHAHHPYEIFEVSANQEMFGIYNDEGVELWPSDCVAEGNYLDSQARKLYNSTAKVPETKPTKGVKHAKKVPKEDLEDW